MKLPLISAFRRKRTDSTEYRADIDGLRAVAVVSVMLFHANVPGFGGGYVGVDVFFVISGYLITGILTRELAEGRFSFLGFYERRIRRIFPALFTMLLAVTAIGIVIFPPQQLRDYARSMLSLLGLSSNLYFRHTSLATGYFADESTVQYLLHTWTLSLEEQFYLFFPMLLLCLHRLARRSMLPLLLGLACLSYIAGVLEVRAHPVTAFYLLPGRAWELMLGAILAMNALPALRTAWARSLLGAVGLAGILYAVVAYSSATPFPGAAALLPCIGTALILYSGQHGASRMKSLLGLPPLVFVGLISYSLYLWHWPAIVLTKYFYADYATPPSNQIPGMVISFGLAIVTFAWVETPFRLRRIRQPKTHAAVWTGLAASAVMAVVCGALIASGGWPRRFNPVKSSALAMNYERKLEIGGLVPECAIPHVPARYDDVNFCSAGKRAKNIFFWGDSHMGQLHPLLKQVSEQGKFGDHGAVFAIEGGCTVSERMDLVGSKADCPRLTRFALQRADESDIDTVFIAFSPWWAFSGATCSSERERCTRSLSGEEAWRLFLSEMEEHIRDLQGRGKRVILTVPFPIYRDVIPNLQIRNIGLAKFHIPTLWPIQVILDAQARDVRTLAARTHAALYDPRNVLCHDGFCTYQEGDVSIYTDQSHLAASQLYRLEPGILQVVSSTLAVSDTAFVHGYP